MSVPADLTIAMGLDIANGISKDDTKITLNDEASALWDQMESEIKKIQETKGLIVDFPYDGETVDYGSSLYGDEDDNDDYVTQDTLKKKQEPEVSESDKEIIDLYHKIRDEIKTASRRS